MYHLVFPAKYRRVVFDTIVDKELREVCLEIEHRYELKFLEIGTDDSALMRCLSKTGSDLLLLLSSPKTLEAIPVNP
jgi:hypothetical protein